MTIRMIVQQSLLVLSLVLAAPTWSQDSVQVKALGSHKYSSFKKSKAREAALVNAKETALKKYISSLPMAKQRMLLGSFDEIVSDIDTYVVEISVQQEKRDKDTRQYKVAVMAQINPTAFDIYLANNSEAGIQSSGESSDFGAMFIARVEVTRKAYDEKTVSVTETDNLASLEESSASDGESSLDSVREKSLSVSKSGGSREQKRDKVQYEPSIEISQDVAYAVEEYLGNAGFEAMSVEDLDDVPYLDEVVDDMRSSGRMPSRMLKQFKNAAIDAGWTFMGMGTIDIGTPQQDPARGTVRVPATVAFKVWSLDDGRAKTVASVRPQVVYGQDRGNASVAETNAYNEAVKQAMETVVSGMVAMHRLRDRIICCRWQGRWWSGLQRCLRWRRFP